MRTHELAKKLLEMEDKSIICQVVGSEPNGGVWMMAFNIHDVKDAWFAQLRVTHPDLKKLPEINFGGGEVYDGKEERQA